MAELSIVKVLEFNSETLRSGAVVLSPDAPKGAGLLFLRGAPAVIRRLVKPASVPQDFDQVGSSSKLTHMQGSSTTRPGSQHDMASL